MIGLIYRQFKPVYWSPSSTTALAEAELEYDENHVSFSAYVKFRLITLPKALRSLRGKGALYALIWTTTPWTLPANSAIAVHNDIKYSVFRRMWDTDLILCATDRIPEVLTRAGIEEKDIEIVKDGILGSEIAGQAVYWNSLRGREAPLQPILHADFVTLTSGSGLVHMAPGHGFDDYNVCLKHDIPIFAPVDDHGRFTEAALPDAPNILKGKDIFTDGGKAVIDILKSGSREGGKDLVWATHRIKHKYPIDWRTKKPLIIRATAQWFAGVDNIKDQALASLKDVKFLPETGRSRLESFVAGRSQWCISRQRAWGVPIPALYHVNRRGENGEAIMTAETVQHIVNVISERGSDAWWTDAEDEAAWIPSSLPPGKYRRGRDTMDVWFDSGTSWTQLPQDRSPPADVYIEGTDQHRGWFQSSLLTYVAKHSNSSSSTSPTAPYRTLITHGFILDHLGRKMSKSIGNVIAPSQITDGTLLPPMKKRKGQSASDPPSYDAMGPDALRLWVASSDYTRDVMIGQPVLKSVNGLLHKLRVTFKWLLGALEDFDPATIPAASSSSLPTTRPTFATQAATLHFHLAFATTHAAYAAYEPYRAIIALTRYINTHLSAFYFEYSKDLLYAGTTAQRREVQVMCWAVLQGLTTMLAPVTPLLVAEVVEYSPEKVREALREERRDPFKRVWEVPTVDAQASFFDSASSGLFQSMPLQKALTLLDAATSAVKAAQEVARTARVMGSGLECQVELKIPPSPAYNETATFFEELARSGELEALLVVSGVQIVRMESGQQVVDIGKEEEKWRYEQAFDILDEAGEMGTAVAVVMPPDGAKCPRCWRYKAEKANADVPVPLENKVEGEVDRVVENKMGVEAEAEQTKTPLPPLCSRCVIAVSEQKNV